MITLPAVASAFISSIAKSTKLTTISSGLALLSIITEKIANEIDHTSFWGDLLAELGKSYKLPGER